VNTKDVDDFFAADASPEPPPEPAPAPPPPPPPPPPPVEKKRNGTKKEAVPDLVLEQGLPANESAEKTILGAVLLDNAALKEISISLEFEDFFLDSHRRIWRRMAELYGAGRPIDIVTLVAELAKHKEVEAIGGVAYLASLTEGLPRRPVIDEYIRIVADKSIARNIMAISSMIIARAADQSESATQTLAVLEAQLVQLKDRSRVLSRIRNPEPFFVGYRTFTSQAPEVIEWTVEGIIQKDGNGLILGDSGTSKSLLVFDLAIHLVAGVAWFHHRVPERLRVGLVAREDSPGLSQSRLMRLIEGSSEAVKMFLEGLDLEDWLYINTRSQRETWSLQKEQDIQEIIEATKERGIHILFFDVFRTLWEGNENDNQETAKVLDAAKRIGREANCQVCIVHHLSKSDRGTIFDRARGGGINGWKEWGIGITVENQDAEPRDQVRKLHFHTKASVACGPICYRIDGYESKVELVEVDAPTQQYNFKQSKKGKKEPTVQSQMPYSED
jgi:hypothetical protein